MCTGGVVGVAWCDVHVGTVFKIRRAFSAACKHAFAQPLSAICLPIPFLLPIPIPIPIPGEGFPVSCVRLGNLGIREFAEPKGLELMGIKVHKLANGMICQRDKKGGGYPYTHYPFFQ